MRVRLQAKAIEALKAQHGYTPLAMIGDGATDLEARRPGGARGTSGLPVFQSSGFNPPSRRQS